MYVIGSARVNLVKKGKFIMAMSKISGGSEKFEEYLSNYHRYHELELVKLMLISRESLEWVVEKIKNEEKISFD